MAAGKFRLFYGLSVAVFGAGSAAVIAWALAAPLDAGGTGGAAPRRPSAGAGRARGPVPPLADFERLWSLDLRRPLADAPAPVAAVETEVAEERPPDVQLTGTVVEAGHSMAIFAAPGGVSEFKRVGEEIGGAKIVKIAAAGVTLSYNGKEWPVGFTKPPPAGPAGPLEQLSTERPPGEAPGEKRTGDGALPRRPAGG